MWSRTHTKKRTFHAGNSWGEIRKALRVGENKK